MHLLLTVNAAWNILNFRLPLVEALLADGHEISILAPHDKASDTLKDIGCHVIDLDLDRKGLNPVHDLKLLRQFHRIFAKLRPDCILSFTIKNNVYGALAARASGIPFIPNVTGLGTAFLSSNWLKRVTSVLYRTAFRNSPVVFFQNHDDEKLFLTKNLVSKRQARLLPGSGIDLDKFKFCELPPKNEPLTFLMIGRILRDKGVLEYVEATTKFSGPANTKFQLLGALDHENRSAIKDETVESWHRNKIIDYLGTTSDVRPVIERAHCVVLPSYREGAPRTLIEAASLGRPLIATDVPGCRAVVETNVNGYLCKPRSSSSLAEALEKFASLSAHEKSTMGGKSREKMEQQFSAADVTRAYRDAILKATENQ